MHPCINEKRITDLEKSNNTMSKDIQDLIKKLDTLINVLLKIGYVLGSGVISFMVYLIIYWVKG
jgi:Mg2+/Co2+ transporter CorB